MDQAAKLLIAAGLDRVQVVQQCLSELVLSRAHSAKVVHKAFEVACVHGSASVLEFLSTHYRHQITIGQGRADAKAVVIVLLSSSVNSEDILQLLCNHDDAFYMDYIAPSAARMSKSKLMRLLTRAESYGLLRFRTVQGVVTILSELFSGDNISSDAMDLANTIIDSYPDSGQRLFFHEVRREAHPRLCQLWSQRRGFSLEDVHREHVENMTAGVIQFILDRGVHLWEGGLGRKNQELEVFLLLVKQLICRFHYSPISEYVLAHQVFDRLLRAASQKLWSCDQLWAMLVDKDAVYFLSLLCLKYHHFLSSPEAAANQTLAHRLHQRLSSLDTEPVYKCVSSKLLFYEQKQPLVFDSSLAISTAEATRCVVLGHFLHGDRQSVSLTDKLADLWSQKAFQSQFDRESMTSVEEVLTITLSTNDLAVIDAFADQLMAVCDPGITALLCTASFGMRGGLHGLPLSTQLLRRLPVHMLQCIDEQTYANNTVRSIVNHSQVIGAVVDNDNVSLTVNRSLYPSDGLRARQELEDYLLTALAAGEAAYSLSAMQTAVRIAWTEECSVVHTLLAELPLATVQQLVERQYLTRAVIQRSFAADDDNVLFLLCRRGRLDIIQYLVEDLDLGSEVDRSLWEDSQSMFMFVQARGWNDELGEALYQYLKHRALLVYEKSLLQM